MAHYCLRTGAYLKGRTYRIEKVLGEGTFGIAYLATAKFSTHGSLGKMDVEAKVAIKEFYMSKLNERGDNGCTVEGSSGSIFSNYRKKFKREAENLSKLNHPNIVRVFDVFDENNTTYYVMEYLNGQSLDDYINQYGCIKEDEAISIVCELGCALSYMHSQKMLHLDIKPKNIMRRTDGRCYLIDFGLSKQFNDKGEPESSTSVGLGTSGYSPLEQAEYKQDGTFPATLDIYALGATMFKMLTGKRPPEATYILNDGFPENELISKKISHGTRSVLKKSMAPYKKKRFQTVKSFIEALDNEDSILEPQPQKKSATKHKPAPPPIPTYSSYESERDSDPFYDNEPTPESDYEPTPDYDMIPKSAVKPRPKRSISWIWWIPAIAVLIFTILVIWGTESTSEDALCAEVEEVMPVLSDVEDMQWDSPLGEAIYSGQVTEEYPGSADNPLPHGEGVAVIISGDYDGCKYEGHFEWGRMEGEATFNYKNVWTFEGTFMDNQCYEGVYTIKSTGEYFIGTFMDNQPHEGTWFNKNGDAL